jgi:hypothetical protein
MRSKKVKVVPCLITYVPSHEDIWSSGGITPALLTSALDRGEWSVSRSESSRSYYSKSQGLAF